MPPVPAYVSHSPDHEDVVVWRALGKVRAGRYAEVRPGPRQGAATAGLYDRGWDGLVVVVDDEAAARHRARRPRDTVVVAEARFPDLAGDGAHVLFVGPDETSRATLEPLVAAVAPWVVVLAARDDEDPSAPLEAERAVADYSLVLVDGTSRFHLAPERDELRHAFAYGASRRDGYVDAHRDREVGELVRSLRHWRGETLRAWAEPAPAGVQQPVETQATVADLTRRLEHARAENDRLRRTLSWRITWPLRAVRRRMGAE